MVQAVEESWPCSDPLEGAGAVIGLLAEAALAESQDRMRSLRQRSGASHLPDQVLGAGLGRGGCRSGVRRGSARAG